MIRKVRELGDQDHFNDEFSVTEKNFTYLVPANSAWDKIEWSFVSAYKILFTGLFPLQVQYCRINVIHGVFLSLLHFSLRVK